MSLEFMKFHECMKELGDRVSSMEDNILDILAKFADIDSTAVNIPRTVVPVLHRSTRQRQPVDQFAPWSFTLRREECDDI